MQVLRPHDLVARASYGIFYMAGNTVNGGGTMDFLMDAVPGYIGAEYFNAADGVHDDLPHFTFDDVFPTQRESTLGTFPVSTAYGSGALANVRARNWSFFQVVF